MISTSVVPVGTAAAGSQTLVVSALERVCQPFCVLGNGPSATMSFKVGGVQVVGTIAIVTILVTTTIVSSNKGECGCAHTQVFTESFDVGFTATTTNAITLNPGTSTVVQPAQLTCCKAEAVKVSTSLAISIG